MKDTFDIQNYDVILYEAYSSFHLRSRHFKRYILETIQMSARNMHVMWIIHKKPFVKLRWNQIILIQFIISKNYSFQ